jgi:Tfp pilus assembly protein PilF
MWADEGKNLGQAESLIRAAVQSDPENAAYLDSLGWVLYKQSKFAEARRCLEAATKTGRPDPIVLDHLGDALYRLDEQAEAARIWRRSMERLKETTSQREDLKKLKEQLQQKLRRHEGGENVNVAPINRQ